MVELQSRECPSTLYIPLRLVREASSPAESPSTRKISVSSRLVELQSASLPGSVDLVSTDLRRTSSRAFLAASAARKACQGEVNTIKSIEMLLRW